MVEHDKEWCLDYWTRRKVATRVVQLLNVQSTWSVIAARKEGPHWGPAALQLEAESVWEVRRLVQCEDDIANTDDNAYEHRLDQEGDTIRL